MVSTCLYGASAGLLGGVSGCRGEVGGFGTAFVGAIVFVKIKSGGTSENEANDLAAQEGSLYILLQSKPCVDLDCEIRMTRVETGSKRTDTYPSQSSIHLTFFLRTSDLSPAYSLSISAATIITRAQHFVRECTNPL